MNFAQEQRGYSLVVPVALRVMVVVGINACTQAFQRCRECVPAAVDQGDRQVSAVGPVSMGKGAFGELRYCRLDVSSSSEGKLFL